MHDKSDSHTTVNVQLTPGDGVFELAGSPPLWIAAYTCPTPDCECRAALVLATGDGWEALLKRSAAVCDAWNSGANYSHVAAALDDLISFEMDIDSTEIYSLSGNTPLDLKAHPRLADIALRIDGDVLDEVGRRWYRCKGGLDPEQRLGDAGAVELKGWQQGEILAWNDICNLRQDFYRLDGRLYEALDMYCPVPGCECGEVFVIFEARMPRGAPSPGHVVVQRSGAARIEPLKNGRARLEQLWSAYQQRHPNHFASFARRYPIVKNIGARNVIAAPAALPGTSPNGLPKVGRNEACPCGSGKKYKRCCGAG
jgi:SEC-C motif